MFTVIDSGPFIGDPKNDGDNLVYLLNPALQTSLAEKKIKTSLEKVSLMLARNFEVFNLSLKDNEEPKKKKSKLESIFDFGSKEEIEPVTIADDSSNMIIEPETVEKEFVAASEMIVSEEPEIEDIKAYLMDFIENSMQESYTHKMATSILAEYEKIQNIKHVINESLEGIRAEINKYEEYILKLRENEAVQLSGISSAEVAERKLVMETPDNMAKSKETDKVVAETEKTLIKVVINPLAIDDEDKEAVNDFMEKQKEDETARA